MMHSLIQALAPVLIGAVIPLAICLWAGADDWTEEDYSPDDEDDDDDTEGGLPCPA